VSPLLMSLLGVLLLPLFIGTWRISLLGLASQGLLLGWIYLRLDPELDAPGAWLTLLDLVVVRGLAAPLLLDRIQRTNRVPARNDVIPPNLISWTLAIAAAFVGFSFADLLVPLAGDGQTLVAVAIAGVLLAFFVLASQSVVFSQIVGLLRLENAIALFELGALATAHGARPPLALQVGQLGAFVGTLALCGWHLRHLGQPPTTTPPTVEAPTL
jgi:hydrogenase-4 component E